MNEFRSEKIYQDLKKALKSSLRGSGNLNGGDLLNAFIRFSILVMGIIREPMTLEDFTAAKSKYYELIEQYLNENKKIGLYEKKDELIC